MDRFNLTKSVKIFVRFAGIEPIVKWIQMHRNKLLLLILTLIVWSCGLLQPAFMEETGAPVIYYLDVESGPPGVFVTVNGTGFTFDDEITIGGKTVRPLPVADQYLNFTPESVPAKVTCQIPELSPGDYSVAVQTDGGTSNSLPFSVRPGNIYFVATNGSNGNSGNRNASWRTLDFAARQTKPGDFIYLREGVYRENADKTEDAIYWGGGEGQYYAIKNPGGVAGSPITMQAYPGDDVVLTMNNWKPGAINVHSANYLNFIALRFKNIQASGISLENAVGIRIVNCEFSNIAWVAYGTGAIWVWTNTDQVKILGNSIHDAGAYDQGSNKTHSIYAQGQNMEIAFNKLWDAPGMNDERRANTGLQIYGRDAAVLNPRIHHNIFYGTERGILISGKPRNAYIYNNLFHDFDRYAIETEIDAAGAIYILNNTFYNSGKRPARWERAAPHILGEESGAGKLVVKNNIFASSINNLTLQYNSSSSDVDYNIYFSTAGRPYAAPGWYSKIINPLFMNAKEFDFRINGDSPAIDAGINVGLPFEGASPDIGAFENGHIFFVNDPLGSAPN